MREINTIRTLPSREIKSGPYAGDTISPSFGMRKYGDQIPRFSITAEIYKDNRTEACGCLHDEITRTFPELADLIPWHLTDQNGVPLHYLANAVYWLDIYAPKKDQTAFDNFKSTIACGMVEGDEEFAREAKKNRYLPKHYLDLWLKGRMPALQEKFLETMSKFNVELIQDAPKQGETK